MYNYKNWPYKWYCVWREYGKEYENYPSIFDFVDAERNAQYDLLKLTDYLSQGKILISTSRSNFPSPFSGEIESGSISYRTDGKWVWFDNLSGFITNNSLVIPESWFDHIKKNNFTIPHIEESEIEQLEWPNL